jgi:hypothetical protein
MQFWFVRAVTRYLNFATFVENLVPIFHFDFVLHTTEGLFVIFKTWFPTWWHTNTWKYVSKEQRWDFLWHILLGLLSFLSNQLRKVTRLLALQSKKLLVTILEAYHWSQIWMEQNVTIVGYNKCVTINTTLEQISEMFVSASTLKIIILTFKISSTLSECKCKISYFLQ